MIIRNVVTIHDNDEFITIETKSGTIIHLPLGIHELVILDTPDPADDMTICIRVNLYNE